MIDHQFFWLGLPLEGAKGAQPPYVAVRLDSEKFVENLLDEFDV
jgi:hypothetical protein